MGYEDFLRFLMKELDPQEYLSCPIIVKVTKEKRDRPKEILAAFTHVEKTLIRYLFPTASHDTRKTLSGLHRYHCRETGCEYVITGQYIGRVMKFPNPKIQILLDETYIALDF